MQEPEWMRMGWRIRDIRQQRNYTQVELAQRSGLCKSSVYSAEHGHVVGLAVVVDIVKALDVSMDYVVLGIRPQTNAWGLILRSDDELESVVRLEDEEEV